MAPRTDKPRLCELDELALVDDVTGAAVSRARGDFELLWPWSATQLKAEHGEQVAMDGAPFFYNKRPGKKLLRLLRETELAQRVRDFVAYAQQGTELKAGNASGHAAQLASYVDYMPAKGADRLQLVLDAGIGRSYIERQTPLTTAQVAALGSCSPDHVNTLARQGQLRRVTHGLYCSKTVAKWLAKA